LLFSLIILGSINNIPLNYYIPLDQAIAESPANLIGRTIRYVDWQETSLGDFLQIMNWFELAFICDVILEGEYFDIMIRSTKCGKNEL